MESVASQSRRSLGLMAAAPGEISDGVSIQALSTPFQPLPYQERRLLKRTCPGRRRSGSSPRAKTFCPSQKRDCGKEMERFSSAASAAERLNCLGSPQEPGRPEACQRQSEPQYERLCGRKKRSVVPKSIGILRLPPWLQQQHPEIPLRNRHDGGAVGHGEYCAGRFEH